MKKLLLIASLSLVGVGLKAQETTFGVKAGYSLSTMKISEDVDDLGERTMDPVHTMYIGGIVEHKFSDTFGIQGELLYSPLGAKESFKGTNDDITFFNIKNKITLGTLLVPISAKYFIGEKFSISAGASFGVILTAKQKSVIDAGFSIPGFELEGNDESDIKDDLKTLNIAPFLGVEYMLENGLFFDARYNLGVSNLVKEGAGTAKNSFAQIGVGFKFGKN